MISIFCEQILFYIDNYYKCSIVCILLIYCERMNIIATDGKWVACPI